MTAAYRLVLVLGLWALAAAAAAGAPFEYQWNVEQLVRADREVIELRSRDRRVLKRLSAQQVRILYAVHQSIERVAEVDSELIIVDGDKPNAFAGRARGDVDVVGVNFAMLDLIGMDVHAAAAMIGHEIAHLKLHHPERGKSRAVGTGIARVLGGVALGVLGVPGGHALSDLAFTAIETKYSRDNEREADYLGAIWALEAGYEIDGAVRLHTAIYEHSKGQPTPFLSTHPSGPERITTLKSLSRRLSRGR